MPDGTGNPKYKWIGTRPDRPDGADKVNTLRSNAFPSSAANSSWL